MSLWLPNPLFKTRKSMLESADLDAPESSDAGLETESPDVQNQPLDLSTKSRKDAISVREYDLSVFDSEISKEPSTPKNYLGNQTRNSQDYQRNIPTSQGTLQKRGRGRPRNPDQPVRKPKVSYPRPFNPSPKKIGRPKSRKTLRMKSTLAIRKTTTTSTDPGDIIDFLKLREQRLNDKNRKQRPPNHVKKAEVRKAQGEMVAKRLGCLRSNQNKTEAEIRKTYEEKIDKYKDNLKKIKQNNEKAKLRILDPEEFRRREEKAKAEKAKKM